MKKELALIATALLFTVVPVYAASGQANHGAVISAEHREGNDTDQDDVKNPAITITPKPTETDEHETEHFSVPTTVTPTPCDPSGSWKNHGEYVSCVAQEHLGGDMVSTAAKSKTGKKDEPELSVTPTITPSITITPTETPTASPSPSITPTTQTQFVPVTLFENILLRLVDLIPFLHHHSHTQLLTR